MIWRCAACYDGECLHSGPIADRSHCPADSGEANWGEAVRQEFTIVEYIMKGGEKWFAEKQVAESVLTEAARTRRT